MAELERPDVSVCLATYNGSRYVVRQLLSILQQLGPNDEIVVVDDASADDTVAKMLSVRDPRVHVMRNDSNAGHVSAFGRALSHARGDIIALSDQDDVWVEGRLNLMRGLLAGSAVCATSFLEDRSGALASPRLKFDSSGRRGGARVFGDLMFGRGPYFGCAMALRRDALKFLMPMPQFVEAHDHWIALGGGLSGGVAVTNEVSLVRSVHATNLTPQTRRSTFKVIGTRIRLSLSLFVLLVRLRKRQ